MASDGPAGLQHHKTKLTKMSNRYKQGESNKILKIKQSVNHSDPQR